MSAQDYYGVEGRQQQGYAPGPYPQHSSLYSSPQGYDNQTCLPPAYDGPSPYQGGPVAPYQQGQLSAQQYKGYPPQQYYDDQAYNQGQYEQSRGGFGQLLQGQFGQNGQQLGQGGRGGFGGLGGGLSFLEGERGFGRTAMGAGAGALLGHKFGHHALLGAIGGGIAANYIGVTHDPEKEEKKKLQREQKRQEKEQRRQQKRNKGKKNSTRDVDLAYGDDVVSKRGDMLGGSESVVAGPSGLLLEDRDGSSRDEKRRLHSRERFGPSSRSSSR